MAMTREDAAMRLFIESIMIFFSTLLAAALVALGEPGAADLDIVKAAVAASPLSSGQHESQMNGRRAWSERAAAPTTR